MDSYSIGDILYFLSYYFTDTNGCKPHYAIFLFPSVLMEYENQILCSVITSNKGSKKKICIPLLKIINVLIKKHLFIKEETYKLLRT